MEDNSLLRAKLDTKGVPEKEYYEIQTEKGYSKYEILHKLDLEVRSNKSTARYFQTDHSNQEACLFIDIS